MPSVGTGRDLSVDCDLLTINENRNIVGTGRDLSIGSDLSLPAATPLQEIAST